MSSPGRLLKTAPAAGPKLLGPHEKVAHFRRGEHYSMRALAAVAPRGAARRRPRKSARDRLKMLRATQEAYPPGRQSKLNAASRAAAPRHSLPTHRHLCASLLALRK